MASSRIFVRGLPPSLSDADFKHHFATIGAVTDTKLLSQRRIGYVGYQSPDDAAKAVKYFHKTFIRMSKLAVELAQPVGQAPTARRRTVDQESANHLPLGSSGTKRKREIAEQNGSGASSRKVRVGQLETSQNGSQLPTDQGELAVGTDSQTTDLIKDPAGPSQSQSAEDESYRPNHVRQAVASDTDWMRQHTKRTLDLPEDPTSKSQSAAAAVNVGDHGPGESHARSPPRSRDMDTADGAAHSRTAESPPEEGAIDDMEEIKAKIRESGRLFLRNLSYQTDEDGLRQALAKYTSITEVHIPSDPRTGASKGFAFILFTDPEEAVSAWETLDGTTLSGRLLHILPAAGKRTTSLDDFDLAKLPLKQQQLIKRRRDAATSSFNWNSLYMNVDAVMSSVAERLGVDKADLLDVTSSDAAIKQAHAETHVIQETKQYFKSHGVNLDAFGRSKRGDTAILVKNFSFDVKGDELKTMFEQHGQLKRFLMPPSGTIAIVEFRDAPAARSAYASLAYRRLKGSMLFLEKAPCDLFEGEAQPAQQGSTTSAAQTVAKTDDLLRPDDVIDHEAPTATLFVRNLNFSTTTSRLDEVFRPLDGFLSARVKTKTDPKKPGEILSMGFGFLEFRSNTQAQKALSAMDGYNLDGHNLQIRASHKGHDAAEERKRTDLAKQSALKRAKLVIKNLPFEATKKDVRSLLSPYGQLRSVRVPKKIGQSTRGFAFAEFTTPKEAENALDALRDTHLLGRRLAIDYAAEEAADAEDEIEKMQSKIGSQLDKVAVQNLMGDGRKKFNVQDREEEV